jgi:hypothetical protein
MLAKRILYGTADEYREVTTLAQKAWSVPLSSSEDAGWVHIPSGDHHRAQSLGDHLYGVKKHIRILGDHGESIVVPAEEELTIRLCTPKEEKEKEKEKQSIGAERPAVPRVTIVSVHYNRPEFVTLQLKLLKAHVMDPNWTFVVFCDATPGTKNHEDIHATCASQNITCWDVPQELHGESADASRRAGTAVSYAWKRSVECEDAGVLAILDSDMFLVQSYSFVDALRGSSLAFVPQSRGPLTYAWITVIVADLRRLPDAAELRFHCAHLDGMLLDTGGASFFYLQSHPSLPVRHISCVSPHSLTPAVVAEAERQKHITTDMKTHLDADAKIADGYYASELLDDYKFLHYRAGSNWENRSPRYHLARGDLLAQFVHRLCLSIAGRQ